MCRVLYARIILVEKWSRERTFRQLRTTSPATSPLSSTDRTSRDGARSLYANRVGLGSVRLRMHVLLTLAHATVGF